MRVILAAAALIAVIAFALQFGPQDPSFQRSFSLPRDRIEIVLVLAGAGLFATQLRAPPFWLGLIGVLALTVAAAFLTTRGLRLPDAPLATAAIAVVIGGAIAYGRAPESWMGALLLAVAALLAGHALGGRVAAPPDAALFAGGLALGVAAVALAGALIGLVAERLPALAWLVPAVGGAIAGVGLYRGLPMLGVAL